MVYGLDKMVYGLPWLDKTAIKWSTGDKMVYGLPPRPAPRALPWLDKKARKWSTGDKMVYGLPSLDKTAIGLDHCGDKMVCGR